MEPELRLPLDILAAITDELAFEHQNSGDYLFNGGPLRAFSQTCKFMAPLCRRHLFATLPLRGHGNYATLLELLATNPDIARYVKNFCYSFEITPMDDNEWCILEFFLTKPSFLRSVSLWGDKHHWNEFQSPAQTLLVSLIQLPAITHLSLSYFKSFPLNELSRCGNLLNLHLYTVAGLGTTLQQVDYAQIREEKISTPVSLDAEAESSDFLSALMQSTDAAGSGDSIIDFSHLREACLVIYSDNDLDYIDPLLRITTQLKHLCVRIIIGPDGFSAPFYDPDVQLVSLGASLATNAHRILKYARFIIGVDSDDYDSLRGLDLAMDDFAGHNVLEKLDVAVWVDVDCLCRTSSDEWSNLDVVLTRTGAFPLLRKVALHLSWCCQERDLFQIVKKVTKDRFPRLMENKSIEFEFSEECDWI